MSHDIRNAIERAEMQFAALVSTLLSLSGETVTRHTVEEWLARYIEAYRHQAAVPVPDYAAVWPDGEEDPAVYMGETVH
jgi:hypothetical protein